jgi:hypothetical protein
LIPLIAMSVLTTLFQDFAARLCSTEFLHDARHPDYPSAFSRCRKLPLATLVAIMLTGMRMSIHEPGSVPAIGLSAYDWLVAGTDPGLLYEAAKQRRLERWTGETRDWKLKDEVWPNPERNQPEELNKAA